jgi:murein DD-endopeptidase MepM/ murein hydrolase activator NlpD
MPQENTEKEGWLDKLRNNYRLVVMNEETFEEVSSYRISQMNVYLMLSTLVVLVTICTVLLIVFTPLKHYIPGYGDADMRGKMEGLAKQVDNMQQRINADSVYVKNVQKLLLGDYETVGDAMSSETSLVPEAKMPDSLSAVADAFEEEKLQVSINTNNVMTSMRQKEQEKGKPRPLEIASNKNTQIEQLYFVPPVKGEISQVYLPNEKHFAVDIVAPKNTAIKAVMDGIVIMSDWTLETGNTIGIQHDNDIVTFYKHNSVLLKKTGSAVKAGEAIAIIGNTGELSSGPHLHFELWANGKQLNPLDYINFN